MKLRIFVGILAGIVIFIALTVFGSRTFGMYAGPDTHVSLEVEAIAPSRVKLRTKDPLSMTLTAGSPFFVRTAQLLRRSEEKSRPSGYQNDQYFVLGPVRFSENIDIFVHSDSGKPTNVALEIQGGGANTLVIDMQERLLDVRFAAFVLLVLACAGGYFGFVSWTRSPAGKKAALESAPAGKGAQE